MYARGREDIAHSWCIIWCLPDRRMKWPHSRTPQKITGSKWAAGWKHFGLLTQIKDIWLKERHKHGLKSGGARCTCGGDVRAAAHLQQLQGVAVVGHQHLQGWVVHRCVVDLQRRQRLGVDEHDGQSRDEMRLRKDEDLQWIIIRSEPESVEVWVLF